MWNSPVKCCFAAFSLIALLAALDVRAEERTNLRSTMNGMHEALTVLAPFGFGAKDITDPRYASEVKTNMEVLKQHAGDINNHAPAMGQDFSFNSASLVSSVDIAERAYEAKRFEETRYKLRSIASTCFNCHTRLPASKARPAQDLFKNIDKKLLTLPQLAALEVANRQFKEAQNTLEKAVLATDYQWYEFGHDTPLLDYLILGIRANRDFSGVKSTLQKIGSRNGLPAYFRAYLSAWDDSLKLLIQDKTLSTADLATARRLMSMSKDVMDYNLDRRGVILWLEAASILQQALPNLKGVERAEANYLLGLSEIMVGRSFWLSEAAQFLEASVRDAPHTPIARKAFALLEEHLVIFAFDINAKQVVPEELTRKIKELEPLAR